MLKEYGGRGGGWREGDFALKILVWWGNDGGHSFEK